MISFKEYMVKVFKEVSYVEKKDISDELLGCFIKGLSVGILFAYIDLYVSEVVEEKLRLISNKIIGEADGKEKE